MNKEKILSILRTVLQLLGVLVALPIVGDVPFIANLLEALGFVVDNFDAGVTYIQGLAGMALTIYGFFFDPEGGNVTTLFMSSRRFEDRYVGSKVSYDVRRAVLK